MSGTFKMAPALIAFGVVGGGAGAAAADPAADSWLAAGGEEPAQASRSKGTNTCRTKGA